MNGTLDSQLLLSAPATHLGNLVPLLPSGPDGVGRPKLYRTQQSTSLIHRHQTPTAPSGGNSTPVERIPGYRAPLTPRLALTWPGLLLRVCAGRATYLHNLSIASITGVETTGKRSLVDFDLPDHNRQESISIKITKNNLPTPQLWETGIIFMVELIGIEPTTSTLRT